MPFCPNCKYEYEKGIDNCSDCGAKLIDALEVKPNEQIDTEAFIMNVADDIQAEIIISKLSTFGIPVMKKYKESGSFMAVYMGNTIFGVDLYVPSKLLPLAKEALNQIDKSDLDDEINFDSLLNDYGFEDMDLIDFDEKQKVKNIDKENNSNLNIKPALETPLDTYEDASKKYLKHNEDISYNLERRKKRANRMIAIVLILAVLPVLVASIFSLLSLIFP